MMQIFNTIVLFSMVATTITQAPTTGCDLITSGGKCFSYFFHPRVNWTDSRANCQAWGGYLASINIESEDMALHDIRNASENSSCWIGLNDRETEGVLVWTDESTYVANSSYANWLPGEPNALFGTEDCVETDFKIDLNWNDENCSTERACYYCSQNVTYFGRIQGSNTYTGLSNNTVLFENTNLYCITENKNTPQVNWSYVDLDGSRSVLSSTTNVTTGVSVLSVTTDNPGYYSCEVTRDNGVSRIYSLKLFKPSLTAPSSGCDLITNEGKCFSYFLNSGIDWPDSRTNCQTWGGDLASIDSATENTALQSIRDPTESECWIGLNDIQNEGTFVWSDGSTNSYRNWYSGEPNNLFYEDCVEINLAWNDEQCSTSLRCYYCSSQNETLFGRIQNNNTVVELSNNTLLSENTTLYCITENKNTPQVNWSYGRDGNTSILSSTTDATTGVSAIYVTTDNPGYYACEVTRDDGVSRIYDILMQDPLSLTVSSYTYTLGIDRTDIQLLCQIESYSLPTFKWKRLNPTIIYSNPLNINELLSLGNSQELQCIDIDTGNLISHIELAIQGPPMITLNNETIQSFSLLPPNINSASVTVLTQNVVLSTNLAGRWQRPDNSSVASNTLTFSTFYVTQGGVYKFYVDNWDGQQTLAIQINLIPNINDPFGIDSSITEYNPLQNNQILFQDTTLYCITETNLPWSYVDLAGNKTVLTTTVNVTTGISTLSVTTDNPGNYSCQVDGQIYTVGFFDRTNPSGTCISQQIFASIRTETSSATSIVVSWSLLHNPTINLNSKVKVYYSSGGGEIMAGIAESSTYNITDLTPNIEYPIRIEVEVIPPQLQTFSLNTSHLLGNFSTPATVVFSNPNIQFTPEIAYTVVVVSTIYIFLFTSFIIILSVVLYCCCEVSWKRGTKVDKENTHYFHTDAIQVNPGYAINTPIETGIGEVDIIKSSLYNPLYFKADESQKEASIENQCPTNKNVYYSTIPQ